MNTASKNIVFDWNGTLFDDIHALLDTHNNAIARVGHAPVDLATYQKHYEIPFEKLYRNHGFTDEEIETLTGGSNNAFHEHYEVCAAVTGLRDGAKEILDHVRSLGVHSLILSNHVVDRIREQLRRLDIEYLFSEILAFADQASQFRDISKGERLRRYMAERKMAPAQTIIIGDSVEEIEIGHQQGLISIGITGGGVSEQRLRAANPHYLIHSLHELKPIMQERGFAA